MIVNKFLEKEAMHIIRLGSSTQLLILVLAAAIPSLRTFLLNLLFIISLIFAVFSNFIISVRSSITIRK